MTRVEGKYLTLLLKPGATIDTLPSSVPLTMKTGGTQHYSLPEGSKPKLSLFIRAVHEYLRRQKMTVLDTEYPMDGIKIDVIVLLDNGRNNLQNRIFNDKSAILQY